MSNILKGAQETLPEYHFRLYSTKDEHGLSNQAIADLLNKEYGTNYDESKFRKEYQAYTRVWQEMIESKHKESVPSDILTELDIKLMEFDKEKLKFQDQKRMMRNDLRKLARLENLVEFAKDSIEAIEPINLPVVNRKNNSKEAMVVISDAHIGMEINSPFNVYNKEIAKERLNILKQKTYEKVVNEGIEKLYVLSNGDQIEGIINVSARIEQEMNVIDQITTFTSYLEGFMKDFLDLGIEVELLVVCGNHSRLFSNKKESIGTEENFERLIKVILDKVFSKYPNYSSKEDTNGIIISKIGNEVVASCHGDLEKGSNPVSKLKDLTGEDVSLLITGHFHTMFTKEYGHSLHVGVGCLGGINTYAINGRYSGRPSQMILTFNEEGLDEIIPVFFK